MCYTWEEGSCLLTLFKTILRNLFVSAKIFTKNYTPSRCQRGRWLRVVNDYVNTDKTTWTLSEYFEGFSQILKEQSSEKVTIKNSNSKNLKIRKEKFACLCSRWLHELCDRISSRKRRISRKHFCLFIWSPGRIFSAKNNDKKSRETVPLMSDIFMDKDSGAVQYPSPMWGIPGTRQAFKGHQRGATPVLELFHL